MKTGGIASTRWSGIKNFHLHELRQMFASRLRMKCVPLDDIADLLGHTTLTTTRQYAYLGPSTLRP